MPLGQVVSGGLSDVVAETLKSAVTRLLKATNEAFHLFGFHHQFDERAEVAALGSVHRLHVPDGAFGFRDETHQLLVAVLVRALLELSPGRLKGLAASAELAEQLALHLRQVVAGHRLVRMLLVEQETALHPSKRLPGLASRLVHDGNCKTVLARKRSLLA